jgi:hypothetical protein
MRTRKAAAKTRDGERRSDITAVYFVCSSSNGKEKDRGQKREEEGEQMQVLLPLATARSNTRHGCRV